MSRDDQRIAVIGMACRFPGAPNPGAFWDLLRDGRDAISEVPPSRWDVERAKGYAGLIDGIDQFDEGFFGIAPREAAVMDPQQRLLLEVAWEAIEDAGLARERLAGSATGVFVGIATYDYALIQPNLDRVEAWSGTGNALSIAANRISYAFDLRGPSLAIDTACSSSLVALHQARRSLLCGESDVALVGGVNALLSPAPMVALTAARMLAADGRCKAFDALADGYVRGEGCGVLVLKRLSEARADRDPILAVIHGSAINQDGRSNGLTAPNGPAQETVVLAALTEAGIEPDRIGYIEAHGTGTPLGDPIEVLALANVLPGPCLIGSVKSNIGHLEAAAGLAGLMKTILALRHATVPPSLHFRTANPEIPFDRLAFRVASRGEPWPEGRLAGVSSFGFGGTNAHVVLGPAPAEEAQDPTPPQIPVELLWPLSAHTPEALARRAAGLAAHIGSAAPEALSSIAFTLAVRRSHLEYRAAVVGGEPAALAAQLTAIARGDSKAVGRRQVRGISSLVLVVPPARTLDAATIDELEQIEPAFRAARASVRAAALSGAGCVSAVAENLAVELACIALWRTWGLSFERIVGTSTSALAASVADGRVTIAEALGFGEPAGESGVDDISAELRRARLPANVLLLVAGHAPALTEQLAAAVETERRLVAPAEPRRRGLLSALGSLFTLGVKADWAATMPSGCRCVELPGYPWQHRAHWFAPDRAPSVLAAQSSASAPLSMSGQASGSPPMATLTWEPLLPRETFPGGGRWLLFGDEGGVAAAVAGRLDAAGGVARLLASSSIGAASVTAAAGEWDAIVDFSALDGCAVPASQMNRLRWVLCSQAHGPIVAVTRGGTAVHPGEAPVPEQAAVWGLMRTLAVEQPERAGGIIDIDDAPSEVLAEPLAALVRSRNDPQAAVRGPCSYVARLRPLELAPESAYRADPTGTYLITGGSGALGLAVAHGLAARGARRVVLASRHGIIPPEAARTLAEAGANVRAVSLDVGDPAAVSGLIDALAAEAPLRGIVHAAGSIVQALSTDADWAVAAPVMSAKLDGAAALDAASAGIDLDFFIIFSSSAALFGLAGAASYAAANSGADAVAVRRRAAGRSALAIGWGRWADIGLGARTGSALGARHGMRGIDPDRALDLLFALAARIDSVPPNVAVLEPDWHRAARFAAFADRPAWLSALRGSEQSPTAPSEHVPVIQLSGLLPGRQRAVVREFVRTAVAAVLRSTQPVDAEMPLHDLGLDSLGAIELREALQRGTGLVLSPTVAIEQPTVSALVDALMNALAAPTSRAPATAEHRWASVGSAVRTGRGDALPWSASGVLERLAELDDKSAWLAFAEVSR